MTESTRITDQLLRAMTGGAWHGPSVLELLADVGPEQAQARPISGGHTIWELVLHLGGAYRLVLRRLDRDDSPLTPDEDWPAISEPTAASWQAIIAELQSLNERIRRAVAAFEPERLDQPLVANPPYSAYTQFIGLTQHDLYHAGQIALLKRLLNDKNPAP